MEKEIVLGIIGMVVGGIVVYFYFQSKVKKIESQKQKMAKNIKETEIDTQQMVKQAKEQTLEESQKAQQEALGKSREASQKAQKRAEEIKQKAVEYARKVRREVTEQEELLEKRTRAIERRVKKFEKESEEFIQEKKRVIGIKNRLEKLRTKHKAELERVSKLTRDEAREVLMKEIKEDMRDYEAKEIRKTEKEISEVADDKARHILIEAMQSIATDYVSETTTSTIKVDDENIKGRIIGKEGRNIRAFEDATGVDLVIDEAPKKIGISCFDPLRREIARVAMTQLIDDGRIHPGTIEEEIRKAKKEIAAEIRKNGQILAEEGGWSGINADLIKLLGKMKYRTSYGQSLMAHTIEVIRLGAIIAEEIGADVDLVKRACLLHDVGKVLTHKVKGAHHHISGQIARKYDLDDKLVNAIESHHLDIEPQSVEAVVVYIADAISGARPGARKDSYEQYIKRVESLENVAHNVGGDSIDEVFAIHAGREVRVIVKPQVIEDTEIPVLAKNISDKIEETQTYPGTVKVTVIRESRAESVAN